MKTYHNEAPQHYCTVCNHETSNDTFLNVHNSVFITAQLDMAVSEDDISVSNSPDYIPNPQFIPQLDGFISDSEISFTSSSSSGYAPENFWSPHL